MVEVCTTNLSSKFVFLESTESQGDARVFGFVFIENGPVPIYVYFLFLFLVYDCSYSN